MRAVFDSDESPEVTGPLAAYLALFHVAGPRDLAAHVSAIPLNAEFFSAWNATGPDLRSVLKPDGGHVFVRTRHSLAGGMRLMRDQ